METPIRIALVMALCLTVIPPFLYLAVLTVAAPFGLRGPKVRNTRLRRMAILIPAHNEQTVIGRLLESLRELDYPKQFVDVFVVADNSSDATADIARANGAIVFERFDPQRRSKGHALAWLLDRLQAEGRVYEGYTIVDADSVLSPNFLTAMNKRLETGTVVMQGYYTVLKLNVGISESLREIALALVHYLRPAAKMAMGASCGLKGNGMCFDRGILERFGWPASGLAEDVEFHLSLVAAGVRVVFVPEAVVRAEMPPSLARAQTQNLRWEAGRLSAARAQALPLLIGGVKRHSLLQVDAAVEQLVPPLSVPVLIAVLLLPAGLAARVPLVWGGAAIALLVTGAYVVSGLVLAQVPPRTWIALAGAPRYVVWKGLLYLRALSAPSTQPWHRTQHGTPPSGAELAAWPVSGSSRGEKTRP